MSPPRRFASAASRATPTTSALRRGAVLRTRTERHVGAERGGRTGGRRGDVGDEGSVREEVDEDGEEEGEEDGEDVEMYVMVDGMGNNGRDGLISISELGWRL